MGLRTVFLLREEEGEGQSNRSPPVGDCVAMAKDRIVIPNECEGSKISPCGRNDRDEVFGVLEFTTQSLEGEEEENTKLPPKLHD